MNNVLVEQKDLLAVLLPGKAPTIQKCIITRQYEMPLKQVHLTTLWGVLKK